MSNDLRTPLSGARRLGAAHAGTHHWLMQRITALAMIPLGLAAAVLFFWASRAGYFEVFAWLHRPWVLLFVVLLVAVAFWHGFLGLQVVIEDYVPHKGLAFALITILRLGTVAAALLGVIAAAMVGFRSF